MYKIRDISTIDNKNIKIGKTFKYGDNYHLTNIYYMSSGNNIDIKEVETKRQDAVDDKTKLIIQTPIMYIPNSIIYFNDKPFLELSFNNEENDKQVLEFKNWCLELENYIFKLIKRRTSLNIVKDNLCSVIKNGYRSNISTKLLVPINLNISKCILSDDGKRNKILFNWDIPVPTYAISIIWVKNIWVKKDRWGINLFMYASRVMNSHILDPRSFLGLDDLDNKNIKPIDIINKFHNDDKFTVLVGQVPEYVMYFKMLKLGIPIDAVKQKMTLMQLDSRIIDYPENTPYVTVLHYISNPHLVFNTNTTPQVLPPPPPLQPLLFNNGVVDRKNLLNDIASGGFKLKKVSVTESVVKNYNPNKLNVPSLSDIQNALSKLKKVEIE